MTEPPARIAPPALDDTQADLLVGQAVAAATAAGLRVAAVVVDAAGQLVAARRQADSYPTTFALAQAKAFTSANFGRDSGEMARALGSAERAIHLTQVDGRLLFIEGGCALVRDGVLVGGIGVSGASAAQDLDCARAAIAAWQADLG